MADFSQVDLLRQQGVAGWNRFRRNNPDVPTNLSRSRFADLDLRGIDLHETNLAGTDLSGANLSGSHLEGANLALADLSRTNLTDVDLTNADLQGANLRGALCRRTRFYAARLGRTVFGATDLSDARGLKSLRHEGPSTLDVKTLVSSWPLPIGFITECGLPDENVAAILRTALAAAEADPVAKASEPIRSIEFSPSQSQAGLALLTQFAAMVRQSYPDQPVSVRIEQDPQSIRLMVFSHDERILENLTLRLSEADIKPLRPPHRVGNRA